jgi:hypothetical protein
VALAEPGGSFGRLQHRLFAAVPDAGSANVGRIRPVSDTKDEEKESGQL